jgi:hypothetical protein
MDAYPAELPPMITKWLVVTPTGSLTLVSGTYGTACEAGTLALNGCLPPYCGVVGR